MIDERRCGPTRGDRATSSRCHSLVEYDGVAAVERNRKRSRDWISRVRIYDGRYQIGTAAALGLQYRQNIALAGIRSRDDLNSVLPNRSAFTHNAIAHACGRQ